MGFIALACILLPVAPSAASSVSSCSTVRITLAGEQVEFCNPTSQVFSVDEDDRSISGVGYAGLHQREGFAFLNVRAVSAGNSPGPEMPVYNSTAAEYKQDMAALEASRPGATVLDGPSADLWGEAVTGLQVDTQQGGMRTVEWFIEHNSRLWIFNFTWDTRIQNAAEWETAAYSLSVGRPKTAGQADTAVDLGAAFLKYQSQADAEQIVEAQNIADVPFPSWWSGTCDDNNYSIDPYTYGRHSYILGSTWHNLAACGPFPKDTPFPRHFEKFFSTAWGEYEFECVELVMRFLYLEWQIPPFQGTGGSIKDHYPTDKIIYYANGTHSMIVPGDIITEGASNAGHAMIVIGVSLDANGTGFITILEQNSSPTGQREVPMTEWYLQDSYSYQSVQGWLHVLKNTTNCYTLTTGINPSEAGTAANLLTINTVPNCGSKYYAGTSVTITAVTWTPNDFNFMNWSGGATGSANPLKISMDADTSITANYLQAPAGFTKTSPEDGAMRLSTQVVLAWNASDRATSYEYCLVPGTSTTCDTDDVPSAWISVGAATSVTVTKPAGTFRWNVRARNAADTTHGGASWTFALVNAPNKLFTPFTVR